MKNTQFLKSIALFAFLALGACSHSYNDHDDKPVVAPLPDSTASLPCPQRTQVQFENLRAAQDKWYADHGSPAPSDENKAQFKAGTNGHAVMLVHGFISSPQAMQDLAKVLSDAGDTVYSPLITGYGSDAHAANAATTDDWRQTITDGVALLKQCYPNVTIVAHSLGGALVTDELQNYDNLKGVTNIVMLAPYLKVEQPWPAILVEAITSGLADIDVGTLQKQTGVDPYSYLPLKRPKPGEPAAFLPLKAMGRVLDLQKKFEAAAKPNPSLTVLLAESEADPVINGGFAAQYINQITPNLSRITYQKSENIGHSIETPADNPRFAELAQKVQDAVAAH